MIISGLREVLRLMVAGRCGRPRSPCPPDTAALQHPRACSTGVSPPWVPMKRSSLFCARPRPFRIARRDKEPLMKRKVSIPAIEPCVTRVAGTCRCFARPSLRQLFPAAARLTIPSATAAMRRSLKGLRSRSSSAWTRLPLPSQLRAARDGTVGLSRAVHSHRKGQAGRPRSPGARICDASARAPALPGEDPLSQGSWRLGSGRLLRPMPSLTVNAPRRSRRR